MLLLKAFILLVNCSRNPKNNYSLTSLWSTEPPNFINSLLASIHVSSSIGSLLNQYDCPVDICFFWLSYSLFKAHNQSTLTIPKSLQNYPCLGPTAEQLNQSLQEESGSQYFSFYKLLSGSNTQAGLRTTALMNLALCFILLTSELWSLVRGNHN